MTRDESGSRPTCGAGGTSGDWNAANGDSGGWQAWHIDLSAYAGHQVEVSTAYIRWGSRSRYGISS